MELYEKSIINRIKEEKNSTLKILEDTRKLKAEENKRVKLNRKIEEYKWEQFKKIIEGQRYFRIDHINKLNLPYEICIHLSAKNAGKTTEIYRIISKILEKGEKFMYGRVSNIELESEIEEFINKEESPVYPIKSNNKWYFYKKTDIVDWQSKTMIELNDGEVICSVPTVTKLRNNGYNFVGKGFTFLASNSLSGGKYEGYNTIIFDEILSYSPVNRVNNKVLHAWSCALNTIQRNKKDLKVYLFGNLQDEPNSPILDFYGIDSSDNFRYIERIHNNNPCRILFVNSMGLYENTIGNKGGASLHADAEKIAFLKHNKVIKPTGNILTPHIFDNLEHELSFAAYTGVLNNEIAYVELRSAKNNENDYNCITCSKLKLSTIVNGEIYSDTPTIYNSFENVTPRYSIESIFNLVYRLFKNKNLYFDSFASMELYKSLLNCNSNYIYENQTNLIWASR